MDSSSSSNSDTLIVVTFNPDTLTATMLSIPRDSYVPISCNGNAKSKITHAGWQGVSCVENTIENFLDIDIDYYVKLNFKGLVGLVDALEELMFLSQKIYVQTAPIEQEKFVLKKECSI